MRSGIATVCLSGTLEDKLHAAASAGFDGVEIFENDLIAAHLSPEQVRRHCADLGLSIDLYQPFRDFEAVPERTVRANLRRVERKFDLMERLGVDTVLVCSSVAAEAIDDDDLAAEQLHRLARLAGDRGIRVAYEALAWGRFVNTWRHSWEIVRRADHPALGLCLDSFHVLSRNDDIAGIAEVPGEKLFFLQLADAPDLRMDVLQWSRHHRLFPGQGSFDLTSFTSQVLEAGYRGPLSLEVFNDVYRQSAPDRAAVDAKRSLITLEDRVVNAPVDGGHRPGSRESDLVQVPAAPELSGYAFVELAVDERTGPDVERTLTAMGFAHVGQHRSKPVQLWQQGHARVLVNSGAQQPTTLSALAVDSTDPATSARRARALLAPGIERALGQREADLSAVATPDGTALFFCRTAGTSAKSSPSDDWLSDFILSGVDGSVSVAGISGIDRVGLAQSFDYFDEATLFYRAVLGLSTRHSGEFAAPFGLVRSLAVAEEHDRVRMMLHGTVLRRGSWAPDVPDPQHIAFVTHDIVASARVMRARGAPLLAIPDNYFDDLEARIELPEEVHAVLRECQILYDRDEGGEFFHFFTEMLGSRVFLEVVQRVGDYAGDGVANTPVRMAAQRAARRVR